MQGAMAKFSVKTDEKLLEQIAKAAKRKLTPEEIEQQRLSFIYAGLPKDSPMSKVEIEKVLKKAS